MTLVHAEKLPAREWRHTNLRALIDSFCESDSKVVKIVFTDKDYSSLTSAYNAWHKAIKRSKRPVKIAQRNHELYLMKIV